MPASSIQTNPSGPRISEPVRLDPPAQWGAPQHRLPGSRAKTPSTGSRGNNKLGDFAILASACRRAGKLKEEAIAQYCRFANAQRVVVAVFSSSLQAHAGYLCAPP